MHWSYHSLALSYQYLCFWQKNCVRDTCQWPPQLPGLLSDLARVETGDTKQVSPQHRKEMPLKNVNPLMPQSMLSFPRPSHTKCLWAHNSDLVSILYALILIVRIRVRPQFCTWHDSWAVMPCAKLWADLIISFHVRAKHNFARFESWAQKLFVTWVPTSMLPCCFISHSCNLISATGNSCIIR